MRRIRKQRGWWVCAACGRPCPDQAAPHRGKCACEEPRLGLGDLVEAGLTAVGITKERVQRVANAVGIKDCGCGKRKAALNRLSDRLLGRDSEPPKTA
jgi:hypothetical protein